MAQGDVVKRIDSTIYSKTQTIYLLYIVEASDFVTTPLFEKKQEGTGVNRYGRTDKRQHGKWKSHKSIDWVYAAHGGRKFVSAVLQYYEWDAY